MPSFRDIRDFESYKEREEAPASSRMYDFLAERDVFSDISSPLFQPVSGSPSPLGEGDQGDGGTYLPPQNLDGRTFAGRRSAPSTVFGNEAWLRVGESKAQGFATPSVAAPCVARRVRREVMFARRKAGHGYRVRHRRNFWSDVEC